jgi:hypothetical protein
LAEDGGGSGSVSSDSSSESESSESEPEHSSDAGEEADHQADAQSQGEATHGSLADDDDGGHGYPATVEGQPLRYNVHYNDDGALCCWCCTEWLQHGTSAP